MWHRPDALMLFAAGFGTRMMPLTAARPKPLIAVGGKALIDHALGQVDGTAIRKIVVNLHYLAPMIRDHLAARTDIELSDESPMLLDTGGGLRRALPRLGPGPVYTLNTDAVWSGANALGQLSEAWDPSRMVGLLLLVPKERAMGHDGPGDFAMGDDGCLSRGAQFVYTGAQIITTGLLARITEPTFSLNRIWDMLMAEGRLFGVAHDGNWCDVGRPESIPLAEALLNGGGNV